MKRALLLAIAGGVCIYCFLLFIYGPSGVYAYEYLEERGAAMNENIDAMRATTAVLESKIGELGGDEDLIAQKARDLGYIRENEMIIVLDGAGRTVWEPGTGAVVQKAESYLLSDQDCELYAILCSVVLFFIGILVRGEREERRRQPELGWE